MPLGDKAAVADFVIENEGTLEQAAERVDEVHEALLSRFSEASP